MPTIRKSVPPMSIDGKNNAHMGSGSEILRRALQGRTIAATVPHLSSVLDSLPTSAVVLDVGSGPGGITLDIAKRYPHLQVFGIDIDEVSLKLAEEALKQANLSNLKYARGDAVNLDALGHISGFGIVNEGCDLVYTHAAVCHMPNQLQVIKHLRRACKPNAILSMSEGDAELFFSWPHMPSMLSAFPRFGAAKGADLTLGRKLLALSLAAGYNLDDVRRVSMEASTTYRPHERLGIMQGFSEMFQGLGRDPEIFTAAGVEAADLDTIRRELEDWSRVDGAIISFPTMVVVLEKHIG